MDAADVTNDAPDATGEAEPIRELCGASIGIFPERGPDWLHYAGDGTWMPRQIKPVLSNGPGDSIQPQCPVDGVADR